MKELEKIHRTISKQLPVQRISTLLVIDSILGQNSFEQTRLFNESIQLNGIVLTKMDSTSKGGIIFSIASEFAIPVAFTSFGEQIEQLNIFNAQQYLSQFL